MASGTGTFDVFAISLSGTVSDHVMNITAGLLNHGQPGVNSSGTRFAGEAAGDGWNNRDYTAPDMIRHDNTLLPVYL